MESTKIVNATSNQDVNEIIVNNKNKFSWGQFKNHIFKFAPYYATPIAIFILYAITLSLYNVYPFGNNSASNYDLLAQIAPYLEHYFDVLKGESSLFYTFSLGGGMDVFGILAFCSLSPFTPLFLIFGEGNVYHAVSIVLPCKLALTAVVGIYFCRVKFKNLDNICQVIMGVLYAFCGYIYVANTYINWMDMLIYLPFVVLGFEKLVKTGKIRYFGIALALMLITCFSIASFSMFIIFPITISYCFICVKKDKRSKAIANMCLGYALAIAISLPVLVPSLFAFMTSGRNTGIFTTFFTSSFDEYKLYYKFSYILADGLFVLLTFIYFLNSKAGDKKALFLLVALIISLFPCLIDESMVLLNFGNYNSYTLRFGFINSFLLFYIGGISLNGIMGKDKTKAEVSERKTMISSTVFAMIVLALVLLMVKFFNYISYGEFKEDKPFYDVFGRFAHSLGGLEFTAVFLGVIALLCGLIAIGVKFKFFTIKYITPIFAMFLCVQVVFYNSAMIEGNVTSSVSKYDEFAELLEQVNEVEPNNQYRLKSYENYISTNASLTLGTSSVSGFSSMMDKKNITAGKFLKYSGNGSNSLRSNGGSVFADCLMGYKYIIYENKSSAYEYKNHLSDNYYISENYRIYENEWVFPNCVVTDNKELTFDKDQYDKGLDIIYEFLHGSTDFNIEGQQNQGVLYPLIDDNNQLLGDKEISFLSINSRDTRDLSELLQTRKVEYSIDKSNITTNTFNAKAGQYLFLNYVNIDGWKAYVNGKEVQLIENSLDFMLLPLVEGQNKVELKYTSPYIKYSLYGLIAGLILVGLIALCHKVKWGKIEQIKSFAISVGATIFTIIIVGYFYIFPLVIFIKKYIEGV